MFTNFPSKSNKPSVHQFVATFHFKTTIKSSNMWPDLRKGFSWCNYKCL